MLMVFAGCVHLELENGVQWLHRKIKQNISNFLLLQMTKQYFLFRSMNSSDISWNAYMDFRFLNILKDVLNICNF